MANTQVVDKEHAKLMLAYDNASKTFEETITGLWNRHTSIQDVDDPLIKILKHAFKQQEESGGKTCVGGYIQSFINGNSGYIPPVQVKSLYDDVIATDTLCQRTMSAARDEFQRVVTFDILYDYHVEKRDSNQVDYNVDDDVY